MQADPGAEPRAKSHPRHTLTPLYVRTEHVIFFFPIDPDTHILPPESRLSQSKRGSLFYWSASPLFSYGGGSKWGNLLDLLHWGPFKPTVVPRGRHTGPTQLTQRNIESASLQQIMGWFIITRLSLIAPLQIWPTHLTLNHLTAFIKSPQFRCSES